MNVKAGSDRSRGDSLPLLLWRAANPRGVTRQLDAERRPTFRLAQSRGHKRALGAYVELNDDSR
jgi:hypothetical protein